MIDLLQNDAPEILNSTLKNYCSSRMGIYEHVGQAGNHVRLRELLTNHEFVCHVPTGYKGKRGELWFARIGAPVIKNMDYHVVLTTPYVLLGATCDDWTAFLNRALLGADDRGQALHDLLKFGNDRLNWLEYVFQAFCHAQYDAVFLTGLPDVAGSLPHSSVYDADNPSASLDAETTADKFRQILQRHGIDGGTGNSGRTSRPRRATPRATRSPKSVINKPAHPVAADSRAESNASTRRVFQFKIQLKSIKPAIWRRILIEDCTLETLHRAIQEAFGWSNCHLHEFRHGTQSFMPRGEFSDEFPDSLDTAKQRISRLLDSGNRLSMNYIYDFGDHWSHSITLEKILDVDGGLTSPICIAGKRSCPPEDCGGPPNFQRILRTLDAVANGDRRMAHALGDFRNFDPAGFDIHSATERMKSIILRR